MEAYSRRLICRDRVRVCIKKKETKVNNESGISCVRHTILVAIVLDSMGRSSEKQSFQ